MLMALGPSGRIAAASAQRPFAYYCPGCTGPVTLKRGRIVTPHFAHAPEARCAYAHAETAQHLAAKAQLAAAFMRRGLRVELEAEVLSSEGDRRADILVHDPLSRMRVAIEVQHSALSVEAIERRTRAYAAAGVPVIWIATLDLHRLQPRKLSASRLLAVDRYPVAPWKRFAAAYHGVLWFWNDGALWRGWLDDAWTGRRSHEDDPDPSWSRSRRWGGLTLDGPYAPDALRIARRASRIEPHEDFAFPTGFAANFVVRIERTQARSPALTAWTDRHGRVTPSLSIAARSATASWQKSASPSPSLRIAA